MAITSDGKTLVSGSLDKTIKLWDLTTYKERTTLKGHADSVLCVALAPDGRTLASASRDGSIKVWDLASEKERLSFDNPGFGAVSLAISADGRTLAAGRWDKTVKLWDLATGRERATVKTGDVRCVAFTGDGNTLAVGGHELPGANFVATVKLWEVTTGKERSRLKGHGGEIRFLVSAPDGRTVATTAVDDSTVKLWEVLTGRERASFAGIAHGGTLPAFTADGKVLAIGGAEAGTVKLLDLSTGDDLATLKRGANAVHAVAFTPDGTTLAAAEGPDTTIRLWGVSGWTRARKRPAGMLTDKQLEALWTDLAGADAGQAHRARWVLAAAPEQTVPWLQERLRPIAAPNPEQIARLLADLDSETFQTREKATRDLAALGESAGPAMRKALAGETAAEVRRRLEPLLAALERPEDSPERLRVLRAIEALEDTGTPEARRILERVAGGMPEARVTAEAKQSLNRLVKQPAPANPKPDKPEVVKERVRAQWRNPDEFRIRITGKVTVDDANTLRFADGTRVTTCGTMDAPDLAQRALFGDKLYACGQDAANFLKKLIDDRPVSFYAFAGGNDRDDSKRVRGVCFVGETNLGEEMVRNGWALAHHSGMTVYEILARENKRGLWRGPFILPDLWRKGERLPAEAADSEAKDKALASIRKFDPILTVDETRPGKPVVAIQFRANAGKVTDDDLVHLKQFPELRSVDIPSKPLVTDAGLEHLVGLTQLEVLNLNWTKVTPEGVVRLVKDRTKLQGLELSGVKFRDDDLIDLKRLTELRALSLRASLVTDKGMGHLKPFTKLRVLSLMSTSIGDAGLEPLQGLTDLEDLDLDRTAITDAGLRHLSGLRKLRRLQMAHTAVTDAGLEHFQGLESLRTLNVRGTKVTKEAADKLKQHLPEVQVQLGPAPK
jgi:endonuclease YncB( thermonuclease family)